LFCNKNPCFFIAKKAGIFLFSTAFVKQDLFVSLTFLVRNSGFKQNSVIGVKRNKRWLFPIFAQM